MTYNGTHFNVNEVKKMTLKQFLILGAVGNSLSQDELKEFYKICTAKPQMDENGGKSIGIGSES